MEVVKFSLNLQFLLCFIDIRILVSLLMDTIPMLANVLVLAFLVFSCFGIVGVQMFQGKLRNRCYLDYNSLNNSGERNL